MINDRLSTKGRKEQTATCNPDVGPVFHWSVHGGNIVVPTIERYYRKVRCQYGWAIEVVLASAAVLTNLLTTSYITVVMCLSRRWKRLRGMEGLRMFHFRNSPENGESTRVFPWFSHGFPMVCQWFTNGTWRVFYGGKRPKKEFCHQDLGASRARESLTMTKDSDGWKICFLLGCYPLVN
jgi:hypothetical protein